MITYVLDPKVLGRTRFAFSPLSETTLSLRLLTEPHPGDLHTPWLGAIRDRLGGVDLGLLTAVNPPSYLIANCLMPTADGPRETIETQLTTLTHLSPAQLAADLRELWPDRTPPRRVVELLDAGARGPGVLAEAIWDYWDTAVAPFWPRICAVLEGDVAHRITTLVNRGLYALFDELHPEVAVDENRLRINKPHLPAATLQASTMTLTPSVFVWPRLVLEDATAGRFGLTYAARGVGRAWEGLVETEAAANDRLAALIGRTRAAILERAEAPISTTRLAAKLGQSPGSVSQHLAVLKAAGLLSSRRDGRSVLYRQTPLAQSMIGTQKDADPTDLRHRTSS